MVNEGEEITSLPLIFCFYTAPSILLKLIVVAGHQWLMPVILLRKQRAGGL
jgi:hypothetical protein